MQIFLRIIFSSLAGAILCGVFGFLDFMMLSYFDNQSSGVVGFALLEGLICAFFGAFIGLIVGVLDLGAISGACVGFLALTASIALFVSMFGSSPGNSYGEMFQSNWRVLLAFWTLPMILTGVVVALLKSLIFKSV